MGRGGKDYVDPVLEYMAWGNTQNSENLQADYQAVTAAWVAGPVVPVFERAEYIQYDLEVQTKGATGILYFAMETARTPTGPWALQTGGGAIQEVSGEFHSKILPFVRPLEGIVDNMKMSFTFTFRAKYSRLLVKGDVDGASIRVRANI